jgi:hypothetical protein
MRSIHKQIVPTLIRSLKNAFTFNGQLGGYVHDTAMSQYLAPTNFVCITGTWTEVVAAVTGTISKHKAAAAETSDVYIPIEIPSNSVSGKGSYLKSVEVDYEILSADLTSITASFNAVARGADTAVAVVTNPTFTQTPTAANAKVTDQHKLVLTLDSPIWLANTQYVWVKLSCVCAAGSVLDFLGAVANYTARM